MKIEKDEYDCEYLAIESEEDFYMFSEALDKLKERALPIAQAWLKLNGTRPTWGIDTDDISFDNGYINIKCDYSSCGYTETEYESMPVKYLFDDEWAEDAKKQIAIREERERKAKELKEAKRKREIEEAEKKRYLELKAKYEG